MDGNNEQVASMAIIDDEGLATVKLIADNKRLLEQTADQVRHEIRGSFGRIGEALAKRERQLLRQIEAVHRQQLLLVQSNSELLLPTDFNVKAELDDEQKIIDSLLNFGKIDLSESIDVKDHDPYKAEEYQEANDDFLSFDKSFVSKIDEVGADVRSTSEDVLPTAAVVLPVVIATTPKQNRKSIPSEAWSSRLCRKLMENGKDAKEVQVTESSESSSKEMSAVGSNSSLEQVADEKSEGKKQDFVNSITMDVGNDHSIQIQQWLRKILDETETEPSIHEIGQFSMLPNTRIYREFPVET